MNVPVALKRQLADEQHLPFFTDGMISRNGDQITVNLGLYETAEGKQVAQHTFTGSDLFALIDEVTVALRKSLELPETKDAKDLRVADVFTSSVPAFRSFTDGVAQIQARDSWNAALPQLEKAVEIDPQFAQAQLALHSVYFLANQAGKSMPPLQKAMDYEYRLPERMRYDMRAEYFMMKQDKEKAFAVAKMKVQLYPEDVGAHGLLARFQQLRRDKAGLIASYKKMLELDPSQQELVQAIGAEYESQAEFDSALHYYSRYAELYPARKEPFIAMAGMHRLRGEPEQARANYNKALISAPDDMSARLGLGAVSMDTGDFNGARKQYEEALNEARTPDERSRASESLAAYYEQRGQFNKAITPATGARGKKEAAGAVACRHAAAIQPRAVRSGRPSRGSASDPQNDRRTFAAAIHGVRSAGGNGNGARAAAAGRCGESHRDRGPGDSNRWFRFAEVGGRTRARAPG
jgi:tetratricopeptide (TPR) repeat protein